MSEEKILLNASLVFPVRGEDEILMAMKAHKIGAGFWNGYGGGPEPEDSDIRATAIRELFEESALKALSQDLRKVAVVDFHNTKSDGTIFRCRVHVFLVSTFSGLPQESKEMLTPTWFKNHEIQWDDLMLADRFWLPPVLEGKKIIAAAFYGPKQQTLLGPVEIREATDQELVELERAA